MDEKLARRLLGSLRGNFDQIMREEREALQLHVGEGERSSQWLIDRTQAGCVLQCSNFQANIYQTYFACKTVTLFVTCPLGDSDNLI